MKSYKIFFLFLVLFVLFSCSKDDNNESYPKSVEVEYKVSSTTGNFNSIDNITYTNASGGDTTVEDIPLPFSIKFNKTVNRHEYVSILASHIEFDTDGNPVPIGFKLDLLIDGVVVETENFNSTSSLTGTINHVFE